jgi:protein SCO1/2
MKTRPWNAAPLVLLALRAVAAAAAEQPSDSLYQLAAPLTAQDGRAIGLDVYRGQPVLVTMFYASCQATCPLIIDTLRAVEKQVPPEQMKRLRVLLVSIDADHDTPEVLAATAQERRVDTARWTLAHADERTVRQVAAALGVQYRKLPDGQFSHATQISVLDGQGRILAQSDQLGRVDERLVQAIGVAAGR